MGSHSPRHGSANCNFSSAHRATTEQHFTSVSAKCAVEFATAINLTCKLLSFSGGGRLTRNRTVPGSSPEQGYPDRQFVKSLRLLEFLMGDARTHNSRYTSTSHRKNSAHKAQCQKIARSNNLVSDPVFKHLVSHRNRLRK
jgi:hypothetical protein